MSLIEGISVTVHWAGAGRLGEVLSIPQKNMNAERCLHSVNSGISKTALLRCRGLILNSSPRTVYSWGRRALASLGLGQPSLLWVPPGDVRGQGRLQSLPGRGNPDALWPPSQSQGHLRDPRSPQVQGPHHMLLCTFPRMSGSAAHCPCFLLQPNAAQSR